MFNGVWTRIYTSVIIYIIINTTQSIVSSPSHIPSDVFLYISYLPIQKKGVITEKKQQHMYLDIFQDSVLSLLCLDMNETESIQR